ncbi:peptidoglycan-binding protein [Arthrobacter sp. GMC3]|uniref:peptidoglycan-binding protein n=1 Tax=Arthrobacter sp. GMC3 TaxID=2058894 RepID=UPI000CE574A3|nr:peptidoglycan-binding protein [Arthrobacter sp. GMC3]
MTTLNRRQVIIGTSLAILLSGGAVAGTLAVSAPDTGQTDATKKPSSTTPIVRGPLDGTTQALGTLGFAATGPIQSASAGVLTGLPKTGEDVARGGTLYSVDNKPVILFAGGLPAWRSFQTGMPNGPDIQQLEENLKALGYLQGEPSDSFNWATLAAINAWQQALGLPQTGTIDLGVIIFSGVKGNLRVAAVDALIGDRIGSGQKVMTVTSLEKEISVDVKLSDQKLAAVGNEVDLTLPGGVRTTGTITTIGVPTEKEISGQKSVVLPISVALADPTKAADLQQASVTVGFRSEHREDVLSVPVEALLALDEKTFAVEVVQWDESTKRVPVTTGLFASGRVEISGEGIAANQNVVVPKL